MRSKNEIWIEIMRNRNKVNKLLRAVDNSNLENYAKNIRQIKTLTKRTNELKRELKGE